MINGLRKRPVFGSELWHLMRVVEPQDSAPLGVMEGERVSKTMRAGRRRPDLLDNEAEAVALFEPMDEAIIAKKILLRMVLRLPVNILSPYDMYNHSPQMSSFVDPCSLQRKNIDPFARQTDHTLASFLIFLEKWRALARPKSRVTVRLPGFGKDGCACWQSNPDINVRAIPAPRSRFRAPTPCGAEPDRERLAVHASELSSNRIFRDYDDVVEAASSVWNKLIA
jgi:hypothetical protein